MNTSKIIFFFSDKWKNLIKNGCESYQIQVNHNQLDLFATHAAHLHMWNNIINLTAITDPEEIALKHFIDSIALKLHINDQLRILDIGSGGGFPGVCLKVLNPDLDILMIDSAKKKVNFLKDLIRILKMDKIEAKHIRAEDLIKEKQYNNYFDIVVSRAFSSLDNFYKLAKPFLNDNGFILAMKGKNPIREINKLIRIR